MPLAKPLLSEVRPGQPIQAQGWNTMVSGMSGVFDGLGSFGSDYLEVTVTWRDAPVLGARVFGRPAAGGAPIEAVGPFGDVTSYALVGVTAGPWEVHVGAAGFASKTPAVTVLASAPTAGKKASAALAVNLERTSVPMPDLIGLYQGQAAQVLGAAGMNGPPLNPEIDTDRWAVIAQYPVAGSPVIDRAPPTQLFGTAQWSPTHALVPMVIGGGVQNAEIDLHYATLNVGDVTVDPTAGDDQRVVWQYPAAGTIVASGSKVAVKMGPIDLMTFKMGVLAGMHTALAERTFHETWWAIDAAVHAGPGFRREMLWRGVDDYLLDGEVAEIVRVFKAIDAPVTRDPGTDLAAAIETMRLYRHSRFPALMAPTRG